MAKYRRVGGAWIAVALMIAGAAHAATAADAPTADVWERRGSEHFVAGRFAESVADFDAEIKLDPRRAPWHWKRGISLYYAGRYAEGAKQFEGYQTVDGNDVENAVWRFLCQARDPNVGFDKARAGILPIKDDRRVPMMQVYALFKGELRPEDVLAATKADAPNAAVLNHRLFYANLYLGLYEEACGGSKLAEAYIAESARLAIEHYMGDVARVHARLLAEQPNRQATRPKSE